MRSQHGDAVGDGGHLDHPDQGARLHGASPPPLTGSLPGESARQVAGLEKWRYGVNVSENGT